MKFRRATGDLIEVYKHLNFYNKSAIVNLLQYLLNSNERLLDLASNWEFL